jgi:hypothetical protein
VETLIRELFSHKSEKLTGASLSEIDEHAFEAWKQAKKARED